MSKIVAVKIKRWNGDVVTTKARLYGDSEIDFELSGNEIFDDEISHISICDWEEDLDLVIRENQIKELQNQRNKLNRKISTLKKVNLKK